MRVRTVLLAQICLLEVPGYPRLTGPLCPTQTGDILPFTNSEDKPIRSDSLHFQDVHEQGALSGHVVTATT
jgi:hypothetical protein